MYERVDRTHEEYGYKSQCGKPDVAQSFWLQEFQISVFPYNAFGCATQPR